MKDILEYTSYRQYIADYYADKKAKSAFTWPEFASAAGFSSPVYLKYVSEGRFNLAISSFSERWFALTTPRRTRPRRNPSRS